MCCTPTRCSKANAACLARSEDQQQILQENARAALAATVELEQADEGANCDALWRVVNDAAISGMQATMPGLQRLHRNWENVELAGLYAQRLRLREAAWEQDGQIHPRDCVARALSA